MKKSKNWLIIGHGSLDDGYAIVKTFTGTESEAKKALMRTIKEERKTAKEYDKAFNYGTNKLDDLKQGCFITNAVWYGYNSYDDCHVDFMLYDTESIADISNSAKKNKED